MCRRRCVMKRVLSVKRCVEMRRRYVGYTLFDFVPMKVGRGGKTSALQTASSRVVPIWGPLGVRKKRTKTKVRDSAVDTASEKKSSALDTNVRWWIFSRRRRTQYSSGLNRPGSATKKPPVRGVLINMFL